MFRTVTVSFEPCATVSASFTGETVRAIANRASMLRWQTYLLDLEELGLEPGDRPLDGHACVLLIRRGVWRFMELGSMALGLQLPAGATSLLQDELLALDWSARSVHGSESCSPSKSCQSLVFGETEGAVSLGRLPLLTRLKRGIEGLIPEARGCPTFGNLYSNNRRQGISPHGHDGLAGVIGARLGAAMGLHWHWYFGGHLVGQEVRIQLDHGDVYIMSAISAGARWRSQSGFALRHAAGSPHYTQFVPSRPKKRKRQPENPVVLSSPSPPSPELPLPPLVPLTLPQRSLSPELPPDFALQSPPLDFHLPPLEPPSPPVSLSSKDI